MSENYNRNPNILVDIEAGQRYRFVAETGQLLFKNSALTNSSKEITLDELVLIDEFHRAVSPVNTDRPWRAQQEQRSIARGEIVDPSTYGNWEAPGGPHEHIHLATRAAEIITNEIQKHLKNPDELQTDWEKTTQEKVKGTNSLHAAAAAGLHDEGREITHIFYSNELIGTSLLRRMGVRQDIIDVLPSKSVMLTLEDQSMDEVIRGLIPEAVILRIADEFGKRAPGKNRLFQLSDDDEKNQEAWAQRYINRPLSGRPSDKRMRENIALHNKNARRYFEALDNWLKAVSNITLNDLARILNKQLAPTLEPLSEKLPLTSRDLLDGQSLKREIQVGDKRIEVEAFTHIGGPNKKFNEDACAVIKDGNNLQIFVVDGGTQVEQVGSLKDVSGGKYVAEQVVNFSGTLDSNKGAADNLRELNKRMVEEVGKNHLDIQYGKDSKSAPYGSIAAVKIDSENNVVEVVNAGDVFIVVIDKSGKARLVTKDDEHEYDQKTFEKARELARQHGVSVREAMEKRDKDQRFKPIIDQMLITMRAGNTGKVKRILGGGALDFGVSSQTQLDLSQVKSLLIFTDGAVPGNVDIHTPEGQEKFIEMVKEKGLEGMHEGTADAAKKDPNFEKHPRFRDIDDSLIVRVGLENK